MCNFVDEDTVAEIYILAFDNTVDMQWTQNALSCFNPDKISYLDYRNL